MARDLFHEIVRSAIEKEGWTITDDPLSIRCGGVDLQIDLGAQRLIAAQKAGQKIAVEIKSFVSASKISEFHTAGASHYVKNTRRLEIAAIQTKSACAGFKQSAKADFVCLAPDF